MTGYSGRTAIAELAEIDERLRGLILESSPASALRIELTRQNLSLVERARALVASGVTDEGEVARVLCDHRDDIPVTASVGMALLREDSALWDVGTSVVGRAARTADAAMYRSKQSGGNSVVVDEI